MTDIIRKKRKQLGLSQKQIADKLGCTWTTISNLERGVNVNHSLLQKVCEMLGLKVQIVDVSPVEGKAKKEKNTRVLSID